MDAVSGVFELDWDKDRLDRVTRTILKTYNAKIHSQSVLAVALLDGQVLPVQYQPAGIVTNDVERSGYPGFLPRGPTWDAARTKLDQLAGPYTSAALRDEIAGTVARLAEVPTTDLTHLLATVTYKG